jgi:transposase-like protein
MELSLLVIVAVAVNSDGRRGSFPNEEAIVRLVGAILLEQSDEWAVQRARYMTLETIAPVER